MTIRFSHTGFKRVFSTLLTTGLLALAACSQGTPPAKQPGADSAQSSPTTQITPYRAGLTATQMESECSGALSEGRDQFQALETSAQPHTIESVLRPLDQLFTHINNTLGLAYLLNNVHPLESVQDAADTCVQELSSLLTDIGLSRPLYERLTSVDTSGADPQTVRFQSRLVREFKRAGVDLNAENREKVRDLNERITELGQQFSKNIRSDVRTVVLTGDDALAGLPDDYVALHSPDKQGEITITTDYPDLFPFLRYARNDEARKELYHAYLNRGYPTNRGVLREIIEKRHQLASLLGYADFASYATEVMMVKDPSTVAQFIDRIDRLASPRAKQDYQALLQALQSRGYDVERVENWQKAYAEEIVRREQYQVDTAKVRQYFQYANVRQGIFQLVEDLFDVDIQKWQTPTWDPSVESYSILDKGRVIGHFYLDMHPRQGKYKHAAQFDVQAGVEGQQLPIAALVCNFPGGDDPTALMEHSQVETFLHEFGHLLHHIFSGQQQWGIFSGVATERDFVEAPSQMLEEWIWDYDSLKQFAVNSDGEIIPQELVDSMRNARDFGRGAFIRNQMFYAALSLSYYQTPPEELNLHTTMVEMQDRYSPFPYMEDTHFYASFGHLFGYSAAYYTYMWSEVIAADILSEFKEKGMRNTQLAKRYRQMVLEPGGSKDAARLVNDFLGRPFSFDAFIDALNNR